MADINNSKSSINKQASVEQNTVNNTNSANTSSFKQPVSPISPTSPIVPINSQQIDTNSKKTEKKQQASSKGILKVLNDIKTVIINFTKTLLKKTKAEEQNKKSLQEILKKLEIVASTLKSNQKSADKQNNKISNQTIKSFVSTLKQEIFSQTLDKVKSINQQLSNFISQSNSDYISSYNQLLQTYIQKLGELDLQNPTLLDNLKSAATTVSSDNDLLQVLRNLNTYFQQSTTDKLQLNKNISEIQDNIAKIDNATSQINRSTDNSSSSIKRTKKTTTTKKILEHKTIEKNEVSKTDKERTVKDKDETDTNVLDEYSKKEDTQQKKEIDKAVDNPTTVAKLTKHKSDDKNSQLNQSNQITLNKKQKQKNTPKSIAAIQKTLFPFVRALYTTPEIKNTNKVMMDQRDASKNINKVLNHYFKIWDDRDLNKNKFDSSLDKKNELESVLSDDNEKGGFLSKLVDKRQRYIN